MGFCSPLCFCAPVDCLHITVLLLQPNNNCAMISPFLHTHDALCLSIGYNSIHNGKIFASGEAQWLLVSWSSYSSVVLAIRNFVITNCALRIYVAIFTVTTILSWLKSWENIRCQISNHFTCCAVSSFPGCLNDLVSSSRNRVRRTLITSIVFQSETAKRARFPSSTITPAYI